MNYIHRFMMSAGAVLAMLPSASASLEDLSDYSEHGTGHQYLDAYPQQRSQDAFPEFSWDTIPKWIIVRKGDEAMTQDEINSLATNYYIIVHEKYNRLGTDYTDDGIAWVSGEIKAVNPDVINFFYWNSRIQWPSTSADEYLTNNHPEWLKDPDAWPIFFDHDAPGMTDWWLESILGWVIPDDNIDGIFVDSFNRYTTAVFNDDGTPINNYIGMLNTLYDALWLQAPDKISVFNGLGNIASNGNREHLQYHDGTYLEAMMSTHSDSDPEQTMADALMVQVQLHREALSKGKFFLHRGGPSHQTYYTGEEEPTDAAEKEDFYIRNIDFTLAIYLMMAEKYAYFWYGESDVITDDYCDTSSFEIFDNPLGEPLGPPTRDGYEYRRSFKYLDVSINFETGDTTFDWKDPAAVDTNLMVYITAPVSGVSLEQGESVTLEAGASDSDAVIDRVEFYNGTTKLGEDTTAPYSYEWDSLPAGIHTVTAVACDTDGNSTNSLEIYIAAHAVTQELAPSDAVTVSAADPADPGSTAGTYVVRERDTDSTTFARHITAFFNFDLSGIEHFDRASGDYAALSLELQGRLNSLEPVALMAGQVTGGAWDSTSLPLYSWATASGSSVGPGSQIREAEIVSDIVNSNLNETYSVDISDIVDAWVNGGEPNYGLGIYLESANQGAGFGDVQLCGSWTAVDAETTNAVPVLYITSPEDGGGILPDEEMKVYVYAADTDGSISRVDFYQDGSWVGEDTTAPYNFSFGEAGGMYDFTVIAEDDSGGTSVYSVTNVLRYPSIFGNLALGKSTSQSSTSSSGYSSRAVDGDTDGDFSSGSVTHTAAESNAWWEVDLDAEYHVGEIRVFNRDILQDRMADFTVSVLSSNNGETVFSESIPGYPDPSMSIDAGGAFGRVVRVELNGSNVLSLAEVEVYENSENLALGKTAEQSSTLSYLIDREASLALDGNTDGDFFNDSVTHTHKDGPTPAWWQVDLGEDMSLRNISIYNRTDSNMNRLSDYTVSVIDSSGSTNWSQSFMDYPDPSTSMDAGGAVGRYVRVQQDSDEVLSLAEVEVFGSSTTNTYSAWVFHEYGLTGTDAISFVDSDGDELSNLGEYAFGGDPTDASDTGYLPGLGAGSTNSLHFVYPRRIGSADELSYSLEFADSLVSSEWQSGSYTELPETGELTADYESVTNRIDTAGKTNEFIRLKVNRL